MTAVFSSKAFLQLISHTNSFSVSHPLLVQSQLDKARLRDCRV